MDYYNLLEVCTELGYNLAMSGAETFRVEDSIKRIMSTYGINAEVFAIPNNLIVSIESEARKPMTRMRRIGFHGNDLDAVEKFNALSRKICAEKPEPLVAMQWLKETKHSLICYKLPIQFLGSMIGSAGYAVFFGGDGIDFLCAMLCGFIGGIISWLTGRLKANPFFSTSLSAFFMSFLAYALGAANIANSADNVIIGTFMMLLPGLVFINAMRDIIYGDTNSGINRIIQVLLIATAIALGTGTAWNISNHLWGTPVSVPGESYPLWFQCVAAAVGCIGFTVLFNVHGHGSILCILGGGLTWAIYGITYSISGNEILGYLFATVFSATYAEIMARIRKFPTISYLVISIFPLIPGAGIYYTTNHLVQGNMSLFADRGLNTIAIAGTMAVGILFVSSIARIITILKQYKRS